MGVRTGSPRLRSVFHQGDDFAAWKFDFCSTSRFSDKVTLPETWLFASGAHEITVVREDEAR